MSFSDITSWQILAYSISVFVIGLPYAFWRHRVWLNEDGSYDRTERVIFPFTWGLYGSVAHLHLMLRDEKKLYVLIICLIWPANIVMTVLAFCTRLLFAGIDELMLSLGFPVDERLR